MSEFIININTNLDDKLDDKTDELYCDNCIRPIRVLNGPCVGCELKVNIEILKHPSLFEPKCEHLGYESNIFFCKKDEDGQGIYSIKSLCKKCKKKRK